MTSHSEVVGTILPEGRLGAMTRLGLLLRDGLPEEPMEDNTTDAAPLSVMGGVMVALPAKPKPLYAGVVAYPPPMDWYLAIEKCRTGWGQWEDTEQLRREYETKADLEPLDFLLEYYRLIAQRLAPLSAMHRHGGKWDELRKAIRSQIKGELRRDPNHKGLSNDAYDDLASGDERYLAALRIAFREAREYEDLSKELARLEHRIEARKVANMQAIKEMGLQ